MQWRSTKTALKEQQISTLKSIISAPFQRHQAAQQQHILFPWSKIPIEQQQKSPFSAPKQLFQLIKLRCFCTAYAVHMQRWQQHHFSATTATARSGAEKALLECSRTCSSIEQQQRSPISAPKQRFQLFKLSCFCAAYAVHMQRWQQHHFSATKATARRGAE